MRPNLNIPKNNFCMGRDSIMWLFSKNVDTFKFSYVNPNWAFEVKDITKKAFKMFKVRFLTDYYDNYENFWNHKFQISRAVIHLSMVQCLSIKVTVSKFFIFEEFLSIQSQKSIALTYFCHLCKMFGSSHSNFRCPKKNTHVEMFFL